MENQSRFLDLRSGVGLIIANMIGAGVFLSAGFMAQDMSAGPLLLAWVFGAVLALCGAIAYGAVAADSGESGGEYRYLSDHIHPFLGYMAGWGSLLLGFSAPIAVDAIAVGAYGNTLVDTGIDPRHIGALSIVLLCGVHAFHLQTSRGIQNALVALKLVLVLGFVALGLSVGSAAWPSWSPPNPSEGFPWEAFIQNQYWIAFAFSGWNAAIYAAGEFQNPKRDVPKAMLIGCGLVGFVYLLVNWVFVANLSPEQATVVFSHDETRLTLGHAVMEGLMGTAGGMAMSAFTLLAFVSAMSAMTLVGPRVYQEMARDGFLPSALIGESGRPPLGAVMLQGAVALVLLYTHSVLEAVQSTATLLMLFSGGVVITLFWSRKGRVPASAGARVAAGVYLVTVSGILYKGFSSNPHLLMSVGVILALAGAAYGITRSQQRGSAG